MFKKMQNDAAAITFRSLQLLLPLTIWSCHTWVAPTFRLYHKLTSELPNSIPRSRNKFGMATKAETKSHVMLNPSGFTLIELIVAIIIIGILAATVLPRIDFGSTSSRASVDGAAYMIASDIRYAQEWAMANGVSKSIVFTNGSSTYSFNPVSAGMDPSAQLNGATIGSTITLTFNSLGEPTAGGGSSMTVSAGGVSKTITVTTYTGKVSIS